MVRAEPRRVAGGRPGGGDDEGVAVEAQPGEAGEESHLRRQRREPVVPDAEGLERHQVAHLQPSAGRDDTAPPRNAASNVS